MEKWTEILLMLMAMNGILFVIAIALCRIAWKMKDHSEDDDT